MAKTRTERCYNFIYEKIVNEPDDTAGLIAYGIYKRRKIEYIHKFREEHGRGPGEEELKHFHEFSCSHVDEYRLQAEMLMQASFASAYEDVMDQTNDEYEKELKERLKGTFWKNVWSSVVGTIMVAFLLGVIVFAMSGMNYGWTKAARSLMDQSDKIGETQK